MRSSAYITVCLLLLLGACSPDPETRAQTQAVEEAALAWISLVDAGTYEAHWEAGATTFKFLVPRETWSTLVHETMIQLGPLESRTLVTARFQPGPPPTLSPNLQFAPPEGWAIVQYRARYRKGTAIETIWMFLEDGVWKGTGYDLTEA